MLAKGSVQGIVCKGIRAGGLAEGLKQAWGAGGEACMLKGALKRGSAMEAGLPEFL